MRKQAISIEEVKNGIVALRGEHLKISVNKGRKKIVKYEGEIDSVYSQVFTLKIIDDKNINMLSFSYSDVICGDIKLRKEDKSAIN